VISSPLKVGFLASGFGSSAKAIIEASQDGRLAADPRLLVSNNRKAPALDWAQEFGVPTLCIPTQADPAASDQRLADEMAGHGVELIVLSGYLRRLGPVTLSRYANRVLNIHPGPLPRFGGDGMYGSRVHEAVLAAGVAETAITIHLVDEIYDHGPVVAVKPIDICEGDTAESVESRVRILEPGFFVETLQRIARGDIQLP
jgi:phosphoribosylglycinamide formyltransferase 1